MDYADRRGPGWVFGAVWNCERCGRPILDQWEKLEALAVAFECDPVADVYETARRIVECYETWKREQ